MSKEKFFLDATGAVFFARQLEFVKSKSYDVKYPEFAWTKMFPISQEAPLGAKSITYRTYDQAGQAKVFNSMAKDLPRVDVAATETTVPVQTIAASFAYTVMEINQARLTGVPLEAKRAAAARRAIEQKLNSIAFSGDSAANLTGLFSDANVPRGDAPRAPPSVPLGRPRPRPRFSPTSTVDSRKFSRTLKGFIGRTNWLSTWPTGRSS